MNFMMDSVFKRAIFNVLVIAIGILFLYTAFFHTPDNKQQTVVLYVIIIQGLVIGTFYAFRNKMAYRRRSVKKLKNPHLQENTFSLSELLKKDYSYIQETCAQAMNDRHTMVNYFLLIAGGLFWLDYLLFQHPF